MVATAADVRRYDSSVSWWQQRQMSGVAAQAMVEI
jgi:hypothetical protein